MKDLVSIIVPVFNSGKIVERCINSIVSQDYCNKEIIIINDGSTDDTEEVCKRLAGIHQEISLFTIPNQGVSNARNEGLSHVNGKWIMFADADDELEEGSIKTAMALLGENKADTLCFNSFYVDNEWIITPMNPVFPEKIFSSASDRNMLIQSMYTDCTNVYTGDYFRAVWGKVLSSHIIKNHNLHFPNGVPIGEDAVFLIKYIYYAKRILVCNKYLYKYYRMSESVTRRYKYDFYNLQVLEFHAAIETLRQCGLENDEIKRRFWHKAEWDFIANELISNEKSWDKVKKIARYLRKEELRLYLPLNNSKKIKARIRGLLERCRCYYLLAFVDYYISWRKVRKEK